jgi:two-component system, NtrC family, sensor kinase
MIKSEKQLLKFVKYSPIIIITSIAILVNILIYFQNKKNFQNDLKNYKINFIKTNKLLVKQKVEKVIEDITHREEQLKIQLQNRLKNKVYEAYSIVDSINKKYSYLGRDKVLEIIKTTLRNLRFDNKRGYYFIFDMDGTNILHPIFPNKEGKKNIDSSLKEALNLLKKDGEIFYKHQFYKPDDTKHLYEKLSFGKVYKNLNIFIATGEYIDDFTKNVKKDLLDYIQRISYGENGYVFVFDYDGIQLAHVKKAYIGKNRIDLKDTNGFMITKEIIKAAQNGTEYIRYIGTIMPKTGKVAKKTTYVKGVDRFRWAVASGFYDKDLYTYLNRKAAELEMLNKETMQKTIFISITLTLFLYFIAFYISKILERFFKSYRTRIKNEIIENRKKDLLLHQQSKMAAMGEMLGNIAHQWRQPLSSISTIASGSKLQKEFGVFDDKQFYTGMDTIVNTTQYLSQTIEDFRNFFNPEKIVTQFYTTALYEKVMQILSSRLKNLEIEVISNIENVQIRTNENELIQVLINILNNAIDAFDNQDIEEKIISIEMKYSQDCSKENCEIVDCTSNESGFLYIAIKDNAGGISNSVINKIFDLYFTTKHKSQGTGIGLYMTYEIISKHLNGSITVENEYFTKDSKGAKFLIILPLN